MKQLIRAVLAIAVAGGLAGAVALAGKASTAAASEPDGGIAIALQLSPQTLVAGDQGTWVTAHTDIPLGMVVRSTVELDGLPAVSVFADAQGNLVAKFRQKDVLSMVSPPSATLTLSGLTDDGEPFAGSDTITIKMDGKVGKGG
jgi:hypothetical protein